MIIEKRRNKIIIRKKYTQKSFKEINKSETNIREGNKL